MAFKKAEKITLEDLDRANAEYQTVYNEASEEWAALDAVRDNACALIFDIENLIESIRHVPYQFTVTRKKIETERKKFIDSAELKQQERKERMSASAGAVAILGVGAAAAASFWEFIVQLFEKDSDEDSEKDLAFWITVLVIFLIAFVFLLIGWAISRWRTARKAARNIAKIQKEISAMKAECEKAAAAREETTTQFLTAKQLYDQLAKYSGENYLRIPRDDQSDMKALKNHAEALAELLNKKLK